MERILEIKQMITPSKTMYAIFEQEEPPYYSVSEIDLWVACKVIDPGCLPKWEQERFINNQFAKDDRELIISRNAYDAILPCEYIADGSGDMYFMEPCCFVSNFVRLTDYFDEKELNEEFSKR